MTTKTLGLIRWEGPQIYVHDDEGGAITQWYVGKIREQDREHIERCLQRAYEAGRASMRLDIRELIGA